jgi:hypothetical protein
VISDARKLHHVELHPEQYAHLNKFFFGNCIGGPFAMKLMERAPQRVAAAILSQPVGHTR